MCKVFLLFAYIVFTYTCCLSPCQASPNSYANKAADSFKESFSQVMMQEAYIVHDKTLLDDFATRYNLSLLLAIRLAEPIIPQIYSQVHPQIIQRDEILYVTLPAITSHKAYRFQTSLGLLEIGLKSNKETYLALKSNIHYGVKTEIHGSMLYVVFAGSHTLANALLSNKASILPASYQTQRQSEISQDSEYSAIESNNKEYLNLKTNDYKTQNVSATKQDSVFKDLNSNYTVSSWRYFAVLGVMVALIILLYIVRLRQNKGTQISNITLEQAKILDSKNKIVVVSFDNIRYVLGLNPNGITFIDKIAPDSKQDNTTSLNTQETHSNQESSQKFESEKLSEEESFKGFDFKNLLLKK